MKNLGFIRQIFVFNARGARGFGRFWLGLALAVGLAGWGGAARAQAVVDVTLHSSVLPGHVGYSRNYNAVIGAVTGGTTLNVTWTFTNTGTQGVILLPNRTSLAKITLNPSASLTLLNENVPGETLVPPAASYPIDPSNLGPVTLLQGETMTVTFQVQVNANVANAQATISYSVGGVYDQVWVDDDHLINCGTWSDEQILASDPKLAGSTADVLAGVYPDCRYTLNNTVFTNDLAYPVTVHYDGYADYGWIANYLGGDVKNWNGDITLDPGESSPPFTVLFGMPWYVGNETEGPPPGGFAFTWSVSPVAPPVPPAPPVAAVPALGDWALALLALGLAGIGARRVMRGGR